MSWQDKVPGGFGTADAIFAGHPLDERRAKEAIKDAKAAGATFQDFEKEVVWHCYQKVTGPGVLQEHITKQVARAKKLWDDITFNIPGAVPAYRLTSRILDDNRALYPNGYRGIDMVDKNTGSVIQTLHWNGWRPPVTRIIPMALWNARGITMVPKK